MIYYPLQLLQLAGITRRPPRHGEGPRGSDDRPARRRPTRSTRRRRSDPRARSHVQGPDRAGRHRAGRRHGARTSPRGAPLVVVLGDNIFEFAQSASLHEWAENPSRARIFVKEVDDPENFGVVVYGEDGEVADIVEKAGVVDMRFDAPPTIACGRRPLLLPAGRVRRHRHAEPVGARRARDHGREPPLRARRAGSTPPRSTAGGRTPGSTGSTSRTSGAASTRRARTSGTRRDRGRHADPAPTVRGRARLVLRAPTRQRAAEADAPDERLVLPRRSHPRPALPRARAGRPLRLPPRNGARRRARSRRRARRSPRTSARTTPSPSTSRGRTRTGSRR